MLTLGLNGRKNACLLLLLAASFFATGHKAGAADKVPAQQAIARSIDREINERLRKENLPPSARSGDGEFCRRVYIDIIGRIPTYDEIVTFLDSKDFEQTGQARG